MAIKPEKKKENITLQTIADELGLSRTTISNAYGRPDQLTPELRDKILATATALGYCGPDAAARSLRRGKSGAYGLVLTEALSYAVSDPALMMTLQGVAEVFDERDVSLLLLPARSDRSRGIGPVRDAIVDGFLLNSLGHDDPRLNTLLARNLPLVIVDEPQLDQAAFIGLDEYGSGRQIGNHLAALGHRRIGILTFPLNEDNYAGLVGPDRLAQATISVSKERIEGFIDSLTEAGVNRGAISIYECPLNAVDQGVRGAATLLDRAPRPTAILATSDQLAIGVLEAARIRRLAVPGALSVTGFDDIPAASSSTPPLTTVRQPLHEKGRIAARLLLDGWEGAPPVHMLPTDLIVRASSGPAPTT